MDSMALIKYILTCVTMITYKFWAILISIRFVGFSDPPFDGASGRTGGTGKNII